MKDSSPGCPAAGGSGEATGAPRQDAAPSARLHSVHEAAAPSPVAGGTRATVRGVYEYYHYTQGGVDDRGWGCAYRSLQTIWSWAWHQRLTDAQPPTHRAIQLCLAKLGDKPASIVGSRQWIGAVELGLVLQGLLGLSYRILSAPSGRDVPRLAGALAAHFQTHGTPVMVGGGVLAYTLLGVDWDEDRQRLAFLILDPHYGGAEDVEAVVKGGWVAWRELRVGGGKGGGPGPKAAGGGALFRDDAFYNFLCPQRP